MKLPPGTLARVLLVLAIMAALFPAGRVLLLGAEPTLDELLQLRCVGAPRSAPAAP